MCKTLALFTTNSRATENFKRISKCHRRNNRKFYRHHYLRLEGLLWRTGLPGKEISVSDFLSVELFALIGTAPSMSPLLTVSPFESWPARSSLKKTFRCEMHGTQYRCLRRPEPLHKSCPLPTQTLFQLLFVHRYTRSQDCVGGTNTIFFFPSYLRAQRMTSLHPVASVLAARKMSHILGQTPPTLEPVYRRLASNSRPLFV